MKRPYAELETENMMLRASLARIGGYVRSHRFTFVQLDPQGYLTVEREYDDVAKWVGFKPLSPVRRDGRS